jgi:N-acetylneuraminic acid mutarotase
MGEPRADVIEVTDNWSSRPAMPTRRAGLVTASVNGIIYAIGGNNSSGSLATVEAYYPNSSLIPWRTRAGMSQPLAHSNGAAVINGKIYVTGGYYLSNNERVAMKTNRVYDPAADTWTYRADIPRESYGGASAVINGKMYVYVTFGPDGNWDAALYRYDPATDSWTERARPPAVQQGAAVGVINGKMYLAGGFSGKLSPVATLTFYNPGTNTWRIKAPMPTARGGATGRAINGKLYVAGGSVGLSLEALGVTEMYDPATNSWSTRADMKTPRYAAGSAVVNGKLYVLGGYGGNRTNEAYTP